MDSLGEEYYPPTISASRTLESRYSSPRLVVRNVLSRSGLYEGTGTRDTPFKVALCFVLVTGSGPGPGVGSSTDGDVFVCESAVETPAQESDIASLLPDELSRHTRTQHGRAAVGLEPSVIHNECERGGFPCLCFCLLFDRSFLLGFEICSCLVLFMLFRFGILRCLLLTGLKAVPTGSPVVMSAAQSVMLARSAARVERTESQKEYFLGFLGRCLKGICCVANCFAFF